MSYRYKTKTPAGRVHLQYIGDVPGVPASTLRAGDVTMWNGGVKETVVSIAPKGAQSLALMVLGSDGTVYERTLRKDRLVVKSGEDPDLAFARGNPRRKNPAVALPSAVGSVQSYSAHGRTLIVKKLKAGSYHARIEGAQSQANGPSGTRFGNASEIRSDVEHFLRTGGLPRGNPRRMNPTTDAQAKKRGFSFGNTMLFAEKEDNNARQIQIEEDFLAWRATLSPKQQKLADEGWRNARWSQTKTAGGAWRKNPTSGREVIKQCGREIEVKKEEVRGSPVFFARVVDIPKRYIGAWEYGDSRDQAISKAERIADGRPYVRPNPVKRRTYR